MQRDAIERLNLQQLLLEPELLDAVEPDVNLVATLIGLSHLLPEKSRATARSVVASVVRQVEQRIADRTRSAVQGALNRSARIRRPRRHTDIDWPRTISANLRHWLPEYHTVVPERLVGYGRRQNTVQRNVVVAIDQSGSMAQSVVYASIFGAVMASMAALRTSLVVFDTAVVDLTDQLHDPVEVLFGTQLGGGTDINAAVAYCQDLIGSPGRQHLRAHLRPVRGRHRRRADPPDERDETGWGAGDRAAGAVRFRGPVLRPEARRRTGGDRHSGLRLHPRRLSGPAGLRRRARRHRRVGAPFPGGVGMTRGRCQRGKG